MPKKSDGMWKLINLTIDRIKPLILSGIDPHMFDSLFGLGTESQLSKPPRSPTPPERYWLKWFWEMTEIQTSIERLDQALVYLGHYPRAKVFRLHRISEATWIRYHVEMYLQEQYILFNRLSGFLRRVERTAARANNRRGVEIATKLRELVSQGFAPVIRSRGAHVHVMRIDDKELRDLDTLVLLTRRGRGELRALLPVRRLQAFVTESSWGDKLSESNKKIRGLCTTLFNAVTPVLVACEPKTA